MSWENHKENIQPLSQGRKMSDLLRGLSIIDDIKFRKELIDQRRQQFERDLEEKKEDLNGQLDLWYEYIDWLEQNVPDGGKTSGLSDAIEQCIEKFYNDNQFKQDERLFDIFLKFNRFCDEPVEIFNFMYANNIGTLLARFYLNWSWQYEIRKNMKRAESILKQGLKNLASPRDVLKEALTQIRYRIVNSDDDRPDSSTAVSQETIFEPVTNIRAALQSLKCGRKVPINRIGPSGSGGGLKSQVKMVNGVKVAKKLQPKRNAPIQIYQPTDENEDPSANTIIENQGSLQPIRVVGRTGAENSARNVGILRMRK